MKVLKKEDWFPVDGFPIVVERRDPQEPFGLHSHEFSEIVIITGGRGVHITGEDSYSLATGDTFVIGGTRPHDYLNMDRLQLINILFVANEMPFAFCDLQSLPGYHVLFTLEPAWRKRHMFESRLRLSPAELAESIRLVDQLDHELHHRKPGFGAMAMSTMIHLVTFLSRCYSKPHTAQSKSLLQIAEAISHMERHFKDPLRLEELIEISGLSRRSFLRAFGASMGDTPINYLSKLRIREGCRLLRESDRSISEIAQDIGFHDSNYFSRLFRKCMNCTPRQYRGRFHSN
jgi:AraC-like DNA-binding protein